MKRNIGNLIMVGVFAAALILFVLAGTKGSFLNTLGREPKEDRYADRTGDENGNYGGVEQPDGSILYPDGRVKLSDGTIRLPEGKVRTRDNQIVSLDSDYIRNILITMSMSGMEEYVGNGIRIFIDDEYKPHLEEYEEPPHGVPTEYEYSDEELLADRRFLVRLMELQVLDGCHFEGAETIPLSGTAVLQAGEGRYLAAEFELCGRYVAFLTKKFYYEPDMIPGAGTYHGDYYLTATHVHAWGDPLHPPSDGAFVPCGNGTRWDGKNILYDAGNEPGFEPVEGYVDDRTFFLAPYVLGEDGFGFIVRYNPADMDLSEEGWDAALRYVRLWLMAQDPAEYFDNDVTEAP